MPRRTADRRVSRRYRSLLWQWTRQLWRRPRPVKTGALPAVKSGQVSVTRGGHATMLVRYDAFTILCDPLLGRFCRGVARTEACGLRDQDLREVDLVLISSDEHDHLHRPSLERLPSYATIVVPPGSAARVSGLGFERVLELQPSRGFSLRGVEITTVRGAPDSLAYVIRGPGPSVFFCGASGYTKNFRDVGDEYQPDLALLPIGGYAPDSFRDRHLSPRDALEVFESLRSRVMVPHRYGAFALSYETLDDPERWLSALVEERGLERYVQLLDVGASQVFVPPRKRAHTQLGLPRRPLETTKGTTAKPPSNGATRRRRRRAISERAPAIELEADFGESELDAIAPAFSDAEWEHVEFDLDDDAGATEADPDRGDPEAKR